MANDSVNNSLKTSRLVQALLSTLASLLTIFALVSFEGLLAIVSIPSWVVGVALAVIITVVVSLVINTSKNRKLLEKCRDIEKELIALQEATAENMRVVEKNAIHFNRTIELVMNRYFIFEASFQRTLNSLQCKENDLSESDFEHGLQESLNRINDVFTQYFNAPIHVCLKWVELGDNQEITISTRLRDDNNPSRLQDSSECKRFRYTESTPIEEMIDNHKPYSLWNRIKPEDGFKNPKEGYLKDYNATLGVPVRLTPKNSFAKQNGLNTSNLTFGANGNTYGFLFLDGKDIDFDEHCVNLLLNIQRHLYLLLALDPACLNNNKES